MHLDPNTVTLHRGSHKSPQGPECCVMELASCLANEPWTDRPKSVHPIITNLCQRINDSWPDDERQKLRPFARKALNTAGHDSEALGWICADWLTRDLFQLAAPDHAVKLRALAPITDKESWLASKSERDAAYAYANAYAYAIAYANAYANANANASILRLLDRLCALDRDGAKFGIGADAPAPVVAP